MIVAQRFRSPAFYTTLVEIFARSIHLLIFLIIGNRFGAGIVTDAVFFLYAPLTVIMSVTAGIAQSVVMPGEHRAQAAKCTNTFRRMIIRYTVNTVLPISLLATLGAWIISDYTDLLIALILLPIPTLASMTAIYTGLLNAEDRHWLAVLSPAYGSVLAFLMILFMPVTPTGLAAILISFEVGRVVGLRFHICRGEKVDDSDASTVISWTLQGARFQALGSFLVALNPLVDRLFAKGFGVGAISDVEYVGRLWNIVPLLFTGTLTVAYANWSRTASSSKLDMHRVHTSAARLGGIALVFSVLAILCADLLIDTLYSWGKIDVAHRISLSALLKAYLAGSAPFVAGLVYVRALSAIGRIPLVTVAASINVGVNLILDWIMTSIYGLIGIGFATSITYLVVMSFLAVYFEKISSESTLCTKSI